MNMKGERLAIVDIGNRFTKIYTAVGDELGGRWTFATARPLWVTRLSEIAERIRAEAIIVVSVVPDMTELVLSTFSVADAEVVVIDGEMELPIKIEYGSPKRLGADRIANAVGAWVFYSENSRSLVVVDVGTATTVDLVRDGVFLGGAILPGIDMMISSLHQNTAQLGEPEPGTKPQFPGKGTEQCIVAGAIAATAGAVDFLRRKFKGSRKEQLFTVLTGGDAPRIADFVAYDALDNLLLVKGAVAIYDHLKGRG